MKSQLYNRLNAIMRKMHALITIWSGYNSRH